MKRLTEQCGACHGSGQVLAPTQPGRYHKEICDECDGVGLVISKAQKTFDANVRTMKIIIFVVVAFVTWFTVIYLELQWRQ
jgi:DnaJ-class molecular chaperone